MTMSQTALKGRHRNWVRVPAIGAVAFVSSILTLSIFLHRCDTNEIKPFISRGEAWIPTRAAHSIGRVLKLPEQKRKSVKQLEQDSALGYCRLDNRERKESLMKVRKILWPTDLSENSSKALPYVTSLSELYGAEVHVLYVSEEIGPFGAWYGDFDRSQIDAFLKLQREKAEGHLQEICEKNLAGCLLYVRHTATGDPASEILKMIEKERPDLVVLSSRGKRGQFPFGNVAEKIVRHSPVPVVTIPVS